MWQRIQTLYLAVATAITAALFFAVRAVRFVPGAPSVEELTFIQYVPYLILLIIISFLQLIALISYKFRVFQMRTAVLAAILLLALQAWIGVEFFTLHNEVVYRYPILFPLIAAVFDLLAAKSILSDQLLVESASHLRSSRKKK